MRKLYTTLLGLACMALSASAQTTLPRAVYTLDFEGATSVADFGGTQVGDGELRTSDDANFGTYYQNAPTAAVATKATNYLRIETDGLKTAGQKTKDNTISLGFWVNPTVANVDFPSISYYYSVLFTFYTSGNRGLTASDGWNGPMWAVNTRLWMQINDWSGRWDDFGDGENVNGTNTISTAWLAQKTEEQTVKDSEGNDSIAYVATGFDDNWHYVALVLNASENTAQLFVDGELQNQWTCKTGDDPFYASTDGTNTFFGNLGNYNDLYLGGVAQWTWADPDPAFAYDDFTIYAGELNADAQALVMKMKRGEVDDDVLLAVAQGEYQDALDDFDEFLSELEDYPTLLGELEDKVNAIDESLDENPTVDGYKQGATDVRQLVADAEAIVDATEDVKSTISDYRASAAETNYPGYDDFIAALDAAEATLADATSTDPATAAAEAVQEAYATYVTSQALPEDGSGIDVTELVLHPWFCNTDAEPTDNGDGTYTFPYETDHGYSTNATPSDANSDGWVNGNTFTVDDARVNWTEGRITWNNWHAKTTTGTLDIHQTITGLPAGYYSISADLITNANPTTQHVYATAADVTKVSENLAINGWDAQTWTTLTTDKVYVDETGTLIIGAAATTSGTAYSGWFCATNFRLTYYGTDVDLNADLQAKVEEANKIADQLILKGDQTAAKEKIAELAANEDTYAAIDDLTAFIEEMKETLATEQAFTANEDIANDAANTNSDNAKQVLNTGAEYIDAVINSDTCTVAALPELNELYDAYTDYVSALTAAEEWNTDACNELIATQVSDITANGADADKLAEYADALRDAMKQSITDKEASEDNPADITTFLVNPSFNGDSNEGWTYENGTPANYYSECEFYNTNFDIYQIITDLPAGYYRFACQGFYRYGSCENAYALDTATTGEPTEMKPEIYANTNANKFQSWAEFGTTGEEFNGYWTPNADAEADQVQYFANTMEATNILFDTYNQNPDGNYVDIYVGEDGVLRVGVRKTETVAADWTIFDNFHLYYLGQEAPTGITIAPADAAHAAAPAAIYDLNGRKFPALQQGINIVRLTDGTVKKVLVK